MTIRTRQYPSAVVFLLLAGACSKTDKPAQGPPPVSVAIQQVSASVAAYYDEYPATIRALNEVELRAQVSGYITGIHFKEGEKVRKGDRLYSIDQQQSEATYKQAVANLSVQQANLDKARKDVERYRALDKQNAIAKQQVDNAESNYTAAQQQVAAAQASVQSVQTNVRYATIIAPFDGTIGFSQVRLGTSVSPGQTLLNTISSDDPIGADISVDQSEIFHFTELLAKKGIAKNDSTFRLVFSKNVYPQFGWISVIDRAVDSQTGTIKMRILFPNPDHTLRAGMSATLRVLSNTAEKSIVVPYKSVTEQLGEFFVYVADSARASQRRVTLGTQIGTNIIIKSGLKEGEAVVTEGVQNLREGSAINIAAPTQAKK